MASSVPNGMFSAAEIRKHRDTLDVFTDAAADFLDWVYDDHLKFYAKWGVSKYYGNRKPEHWFKGSAIGGSSAVNGMVYVKGAPMDYDSWEANGSFGWPLLG